MLITQNAAEAEEAAQDAFVKAWRALGGFRTGEPLRPWLLTIVANEARNRRRSAGRRSALALRAAEPERVEDRSAEAQVIAAESRTALLGALSRLRDDDRLVLGCRYLLELSEAETAAALGVRPGTVKSRTSRALARLREEVTHVTRISNRPCASWRSSGRRRPTSPPPSASASTSRRRRRSWRPVGWRMQLAYVAALLLIVFAGTMAVSPDARSTVLRWLGISSVEIRKEPPKPLPAARDLGQRATLDELRASDAPVLVPSALGDPDAYVPHAAARRGARRRRCCTPTARPRADVPRPRDAVHREDHRLRRRSSRS